MSPREFKLEHIILTFAATKVLKALIISCGTLGCKTSIGLLQSAISDVSLVEIGLDEDGGWRMGVFSRLADYARCNNLTALDVRDIVKYFSGTSHIEYFKNYPAAGLGEYIGPSAGLISHILLPLEPEFIYRNAGAEIGFGGSQVEYNPKEPGVPCYHLGVVINIPLGEQEVSDILAEQATSKPFVAALGRVKGPIVPPPEYLEALKSTIITTAQN